MSDSITSAADIIGERERAEGESADDSDPSDDDDDESDEDDSEAKGNKLKHSTRTCSLWCLCVLACIHTCKQTRVCSTSFRLWLRMKY